MDSNDGDSQLEQHTQGIARETCRELLHGASTRPIYDGDYSGLKDPVSVSGAIIETQLLRERLLHHEQALRRYHNSLVPINCLPAELLSHIFRYCGPVQSYMRWQLIPEEQTPSFAFSRVCRRWRSVALDDPVLWTRPTCANRFMAQELPIRARGLSLDVEMICLEDASSRKVELAMELASHFGTFSSLSMEVAHPFHLEMIVQTFSTKDALPRLKNLCLRSDDPVALSYNGAWTILPSATVTLSNCTFPLESQFLRRVESLSIRIAWGRKPLRIYDIADILSMLQANTTIHSLTLVRVLKKSRENASYPDRSAVLLLPTLHDIELEGDPSTILPLLKKLDMPALRALYITHGRPDVWTNLGAVGPFFEYIKGLLFSRREILTSLQCTGEDCGGDISFETTLPDADTKSAFTVGLWSRAIPVDHHKSFPRVLEVVLSQFPLRDVTSLLVSSVGGTADNTCAFWQLFSTLQHLQEIHIVQHCGAVYGFLDELDKESTFPALSTLTFQYVAMGHARNALQPGQSAFEILVSVLKRRGATGLPNLEEVRVWSCYEGEEELRPSEDELEEMPVIVCVD